MPHPTSSILPGLDPALLTALGDLELVARVTVDGMLSGLHNSPFHGYSAEFSQYRHYRSGDDLKYVDWKLFARTDRLYTKQYRETTNLVAQVMVDASQSMAFRGQTGVTKLDYARIVAAALAYFIAGQGDAVGLAIYDEAVRHYVPSRIGQSHLRAVLAALARMRDVGVDFGRAIARAARSICSSRRGLLILISDLYDDEEAVEAELRRAVRMGHEVAVFHVLTRDELEFPFGAGGRARGPRVGTKGADGLGGGQLTIAMRSPSSSNDGMRAARAIASTTRASSPTSRSMPRCAATSSGAAGARAR